MFGAATGAIAGLATITPAAGFVGPISALFIGMAAGVLCYIALNAKTKFKYDDSLDAFGVHGVGGALGTIMAGVFASVAINAAGANGLLFGNPKQLAVQIGSVSLVAVYSFVVSSGLFIISQHGEAGYTH
jgi:Amt family ammonium transporter